MASPTPPTRQQRLWQRGNAHAAQLQWQQAADCFRAIVAHAPDHVPALLKASDTLLRLDHYRDARSHALRAGEQAPYLPRMLVEVCQRLRMFNETRRLRDIVGDASLEDCDDADVLTELASLLSSAGDHAGARSLIDRAVLAAPANPKPHYMRGVIALFQGDMACARQDLELCVRLAPGFAQAHWVLSGLDRSEGDRQDDTERVRTNLSRASPGTLAEAYLAFALHNELHASGRHEEAWQALLRGCSVKRRLGRHDPRRVEALFAKVRSLCTAEFVRPVVRDDDVTPIFIIGMHRSGTTLLERILAGHSQVTDGGETYGFTAQLDIAVDHKTSGALDVVTADRLADADFEAIGRSFIEELRAHAAGRPFVTEKLPPNLVNAGFIAKALPNARILHMVRDPRDTCFSNLRTYFNRTAAYSYDQLELTDYYRQYRDLMRHWHAVMPGRILDVDYDELVAHPEATASKVLAFCGLPFEPGTLSVGRQGAVATASSAYVRSGILRNRGAAWKPYADHLRPMLDALKDMEG
ncbi:MAG: sulfotransferase [Pseudoxanthomonas sp.]